MPSAAAPRHRLELHLVGVDLTDVHGLWVDPSTALFGVELVRLDVREAS